MQLTTAFQLIPEQSTAAIIVHHPNAKYYAVRAVGTPQSAGERDLLSGAGSVR